MDHYLAAVKRALDCLEANLRSPLTLEQVARRAGFSLWHFQRIFAAYTGEPLGGYLRRRRLTAAAGDLHDGRRTILDLALDYQFESHAAFTRAFVAAFGMTPSRFRRLRRLPRFRALARPSLEDLTHLSRQIAMQPRLVKLPALHLIGLSARFIGPMSPDCNNQQVIPPLFGRFFARRPELPPARDEFTYGACTCLPARQRSREDELVYLAGISVAAGAAVPPGLEAWKLPARTYALFTHRGPVARLGDTFNYIYGTWLRRSGRELAAELSLERYDARFGDGGPKSEFEILIPIKPGTGARNGKKD